MLLPMEKDFLEKCTLNVEVRPLLRDLFQQERYEDIVEAIKLYADTKEDKKGSRDYIHEHVVMPIIKDMINAIGNKLFDFRQGTWEDFFVANNKEGIRETWQVFIQNRLQSKIKDDFSNGIQAIKQSIIDHNKIRANNVQEGRKV